MAVAGVFVLFVRVLNYCVLCAILTGDTSALYILQVNFMLDHNYSLTTMRMSPAVDRDEIEVICLEGNYACFFSLR